MLQPSRTTWIVIALGVAAVTSAVAVGVALRLEDPLSTSVIPAEDPYTHMAYVREHLRDGDMEPLNGRGNMYPPGLHAFLGAAWAYTGAELYEIVRLGPAFLGGLGVIGIGLLLWRNAGPVAAFVGSMAYAVAPETIFRTTMMSPTALDLALVPFLLFALIEVVKGRLGWSGIAAMSSIFMVVAHPWLFLLIALMGGIFLVLALVVPWSKDQAPALDPHGLAAASAIVAGSTALTLFTGPGFLSTLEVVPGAKLGIPLPLLALLLALPLVALPFLLLRFLPRDDATFLERLAQRPTGLVRRIATSVVLAGLLWWVTQRALVGGLPELVDLPRMFGWPILALAIGGFVMLPFIARPVAHIGAALAAATYPFVLFNPLNSPYWPHRTAVFLGIGLVILVGVAAHGIVRGLSALMAVLVKSTKGTAGLRARPALLVALPIVFVVPLLGGGVYAMTPVGYSGGWYRLYQPCEMDALKAAGDLAEDDPEAIYITGSWQSKLVLAAIVDDASRIWYKPDFFVMDEHRGDFTANMQNEDRQVVVVVDRYLKVEHPEADTSFLQEEPWRQETDWCKGLGGVDRPRISAYTLQPE